MTDTIYNKNKNQNQPYVYYLEWTDLNKKYIGCRYAKDCHPDDLFKTYFTSSKRVKELLDNGQYPDIIKILSTHETEKETVDEERRLLLENDVIRNQEFLNESISWRYNPMTNPKMKQRYFGVIKEKYNVDNVSKVEEFKKKKIETCRKNFNVDYPMQSDDVLKKSRETSLRLYGTDHPTQHISVQLKKQKTCKKKYGKEHYNQTKRFKEQLRERSIENFGTECFSQSETYKEAFQKSKRRCPYGCKTSTGNDKYDKGNFVIHMKKKHEGWLEENQDFIKNWKVGKFIE